MSDLAFEGVANFVSAFVDDPTMEGLDAALTRFPDAPSKLIDYLESRFVDCVALADVEQDGNWWTMLAILAAKWSADDKRALQDRIGFRASPDAYRWLAGFFREAFSVLEIEPWLLAGIESDDDATHEAASHLAYHLFDGTPGYLLSEAGQARLEAAENR